MCDLPIELTSRRCRVEVLEKPERSGKCERFSLPKELDSEVLEGLCMPCSSHRSRYATPKNINAFSCRNQKS